MVFYRKYRPQKIDDLDSQAVRETLVSVLNQDVPHAFLFTGPKGLGKTSSARIIAKVVNCTESVKKRKDGFEPCDNCEQCISIANGTNMDILEIDAASNRGIDEIRDLKEKIRLAPMSASKKVYIIDEVHMLTTEAFNALLKTLEEPPDHAMFILCTTEPQKVPATIISRCFHIAFKKATDEELVRAFSRIVKGEKIAIDKKALSYIASLSDGSFRDGTKILEEATFFSQGEEITQKLIEEKYNTTNVASFIEEMMQCLNNKDTKKAFKLISELGKQGIDMKYFLQSLIENLHRELISQLESHGSEYLNLDINEIKNLFVLLSKAYQEVKYAVLPQLPLELAIIEWGENKYEEVKTFNIDKEEKISVSSLRKQIGDIKKIKAIYGNGEKVQSNKDETPKETERAVSSLLHASNHVTDEWLNTLWKNIIFEMKSYNHTIAGVLRGCRIGSYDKKKLVIETGYKFHKERLDDLSTKTELARICKMLIGKNVAVEVELKGR